MKTTETNLTDKQAYALAAYIDAYIKEELSRGLTVEQITPWVIHRAIEAYQGGAR